ncbi:LuxR C-terminal-related transcriptional regulator [Brenneria sp. g21c3]|uniref:helix-turn-helix transcriptional regulator n=1 Tax=Brenneria sp. g21c3 TaxID=3093893 RepID=UPI002E989F7D|nr:LuxR C-terminal-related transcriptional regulator [Brenneria sp. g21c3]
MSINIFSACLFTTKAFENIMKYDYTDASITIFDAEYTIDINMLSEIIINYPTDFIIVLNNRNHSPIMIAKRIIILSKHTSVNIIKKIIYSICFFREIKSKTISLSPHEKVFFDYWLGGEKINFIAEHMSITPKTANNIKNNIYKKYGTKDLLTFLLISKVSNMRGISNAKHYRITSFCRAA